MNKKGQALLVSFAVHLVCIMIFFIVLISILTMTQSVRFTIREFDEDTANTLTTRRLVSTADCLAYEDRSVVTSENALLFGSRIYPNIIDADKVYDYENINCMRKDLYDLENDVDSGVWDASKGTGAIFNYDIAVVDISGPTPIFLTKSVDEPVAFEEQIVTSLIGRVNKKLQLCGGDKDDYPCLSGTLGDDICTGNGNDCDDYGDYDCYKKTYTGAPSNFFGGACVNPENETSADGVLPQWEIADEKYADYVWGGIPAANTKLTNYQIGIWEQLNTTCTGESGVRRLIVPISIRYDDPYIGNNLKPGLLLIQTCLLEGEDHHGITLPEITYKAKYVKR